MGIETDNNITIIFIRFPIAVVFVTVVTIIIASIMGYYNSY